MGEQHRRSGNCLCEICKRVREGVPEGQAIQEIRNEERQLLDKYGWYSHLVVPENERDMANYHTHGIEERYSHPDFQIVLPLPPVTAHGILANLCDLVREGKTLYVDQQIEGVLADGYRIRLVLAAESDRTVLRAIIPDEDGSLERDAMTGVYAEQWEGTL